MRYDFLAIQKVKFYILSLKKNPPNLFTQGDIIIQSTNGHNYSLFDRFSPFINKINTYINNT